MIGDGKAKNGGAQTRNGTEKKSHEMEQKCLRITGECVIINLYSLSVR